MGLDLWRRPRTLHQNMFQSSIEPPSTRYPFPSYPQGWFGVALAPELGPETVLTRRAFGQEIVLFRGEGGEVHALDPHCPHMGAHLGRGGCAVKGTLECPFHGYRFDGGGACVAVPGSEKIAKGLQVPSWHAKEVDGAIMVWYDPEGREPLFDAPSYFDKRGEEGWSEMQWHTWEVLRAHPQETSENSVDLAHFSFVHGYRDVEIVDPLELDGHTLRISYKMTRSLDSVGMPGQSVESIFRVRVHGLGYSVVEVTTPTFNTEFRTYVLCTPLGGDEVILRGGGTMKELPDPNMNKMIMQLFFKGFVDDVEQDFAIWENKQYFDRPALSATDGPIGPYRKWCRQFYSEQGDARAAE